MFYLYITYLCKCILMSEIGEHIFITEIQNLFKSMLELLCHNCLLNVYESDFQLNWLVMTHGLARHDLNTVQKGMTDWFWSISLLSTYPWHLTWIRMAKKGNTTFTIMKNYLCTLNKKIIDSVSDLINRKAYRKICFMLIVFPAHFSLNITEWKVVMTRKHYFFKKKFLNDMFIIFSFNV